MPLAAALLLAALLAIPASNIAQAQAPPRWAKAFAGWVIEGVHGTLCGVVERASGEDADNCRGG